MSNILKSIRKKILLSVQNADSGHLGPSFSCVEILFSILKKIKFSSNKRNFLILSKGHAAPTMYALFDYMGMLKKNELTTLRKFNSRLQGHTDKKKLKFLDFGTGALGQGLSVSIGYSLALKLQNIKKYVFCVLGDGELQEGQIWEAAMYIGSNKLTNIITIIDGNKFQNDGLINDNFKHFNMKKKWDSFGFKFVEVNGHSCKDLNKQFSIAMNTKNKKPTVIYCNTIKGKGVSFMENNNKYHSIKKLKIEELNQAIDELNVK